MLALLVRLLYHVSRGGVAGAKPPTRRDANLGLDPRDELVATLVVVEVS